jgi:hypothetical protein
MNRRGFLKMLGGGAAIGAGAVVAAPLVRTWPFREYFFGLFRRPSVQTFSYFEPSPLTLDEILAANAQFGPLNEAAVQAIELEAFAKEIPDLILADNSLYRYFKNQDRIDILDVSQWSGDIMNIEGKRPAFRIPQVNGARSLEMANGSKIVFEPGIESPCRSEPDLSVSEVLSSLDRDIRSNLRVR